MKVVMRTVAEDCAKKRARLAKLENGMMFHELLAIIHLTHPTLAAGSAIRKRQRREM
jgi:hypothetical protein